MSGPPLDPRRLHVFTDFDGTITDRDSLVFLIERLGGGRRHLAASARQRRDGRLSLRREIATNMRTIRAPWSEATALLRAHVRMDPAFPACAAWCATHGVPLTVLSGGFAEIVALYLDAAVFPGVEVFANTLHPDERGWRCVFRDRSDAGHDKAEAVHNAQSRGRYTIFVGDGISDHEAAAVADEVFAKAPLAAWCRRQAIPCREIRSFADVVARLDARVAD
ncbi:MAG TPA: HAD-IB family phosphatase [Candidatus Binatia bacterium]|nr:HAD-IB family phosphatase [Candidatus Binatia bacterium]